MKRDKPKVKITNFSSLEPIRIIKNNLSDVQLGIFRKSCFGHFLDLNEFQFCAQLLHKLVLRYMHSSNKAMYFKIGKKVCRFSMFEFALVTGLNCEEIYKPNLDIVDDGGRVCDVLLDGCTKFTNTTLGQIFEATKSKDDMKMVKFAMLYFLEVVLLGKEYRSSIIRDHILLIDNFEDFNKYPWGRVCFENTLESMKNVIAIRQNRERANPDYVPEKEAYSLHGCPFAVQVTNCQYWFRRDC